MQKTSIRFFEDVPVRALWDEESTKWWFCAMDIAEALTKSKNPRSYWNALKRRKSELSTICRQLKIKAKDGKFYLTDVVDEAGLNIIIALVPSKKSDIFARWMKNLETTLDEKSKLKAYELFETGFINSIEIGTIKGLQQIHGYIFGGLYDFAGQIRTLNIAKGGFAFAPAMYLNDRLKKIEEMPDSTIDEIISKYIEMNVAHPFMEGNGRSTRIWLDMLLKAKLGVCVDWSKIDKSDYLHAMRESVTDETKISVLIKSALTDDEIIGADYSEEAKRIVNNDISEDILEWTDIVHPDDKEEALAEFMAAIRDHSCNTPYDTTYRMRDRNGEYHWFHSAGRMIRSEDGSGEFFGIHIDITKQIEEQLEVQEQLEKARALAKLL